MTPPRHLRFQILNLRSQEGRIEPFWVVEPLANSQAAVLKWSCYKASKYLISTWKQTILKARPFYSMCENQLPRYKACKHLIPSSTPVPVTSYQILSYICCSDLYSGPPPPCNLGGAIITTQLPHCLPTELSIQSLSLYIYPITSSLKPLPSFNCSFKIPSALIPLTHSRVPGMQILYTPYPPITHMHPPPRGQAPLDPPVWAPQYRVHVNWWSKLPLVLETHLSLSSPVCWLTRNK